MGFFKKIFEENQFKKSGLEKYLGEDWDDTINCRRCKSENLDFTKHIGFGEKTGKVFHYKAICLDCGRKYFVKRTAAVYEKVKNKDWIQSKSFKRKVADY